MFSLLELLVTVHFSEHSIFRSGFVVVVDLSVSPRKGIILKSHHQIQGHLGFFLSVLR